MPSDKEAEIMLRVAKHHHVCRRYGEAEKLYRDILKIQPKNAEVLRLMGEAAAESGRIDEAIKLLKHAIDLRPKMAMAHFKLGYLFQAKRQMEQAIHCYQQAVTFDPRLFEAWGNLGTALLDEGRIDEGIEASQKGLALQPDNAVIHSNLLFTLNYQGKLDGHSLLEQHRLWNIRHAEPLRKFRQPHSNNRDPEQRLRVGYISADFREHAVGRFMAPLIAAHDHGRFEIFCYSSHSRPDALTQGIRENADQWRNIDGDSDAKVAQMVRTDAIDILVDLAMHTNANRLLVFAHKPAPVQATYLAYCGTTGLDTIDYRLTDPYLDPPGMDESIYSEQTVRLPETYWCYGQFFNNVPVNDLPAQAPGEVTFGSMNNFIKVSATVLDTWCRLLGELPNSKLMLYAHAGSHRERVLRLFRDKGIPQQRLQFVGLAPAEEYFRRYGKIDICLDPFPYAGGTTTCDALWMGVPVVTLRGKTAVGRGGVSILSNVGVPELIAETIDDYIRITKDLAADLPRLRELRQGLRDRMKASPLMDAPRFARNVEAAYRIMWRKWCSQHA